MPLNQNNPSNQNSNVDGATIRQTLLTVIQRYAGSSGGLNSRTILGEAATNLHFDNQDAQQSLLTVYNDLFRTGHLAWGLDINNPDAPWFHITEQGRTALQHLSWDPLNPDGYLSYLSAQVTLNPIAASYIKEALHKYNSDCFKATAVMVGCAAESVSLELRDNLVTRMRALVQTLPNDLIDWRISRVLRAISSILDAKTNTMPQPLREAYGSFWSPFTGQIRLARNDAGHPSSIDPVTQDTVHASLLIFPEYAKLAADLTTWVNTTYS